MPVASSFQRSSTRTIIVRNATLSVPAPSSPLSRTSKRRRSVAHREQSRWSYFTNIIFVVSNGLPQTAVGAVLLFDFTVFRSFTFHLERVTPQRLMGLILLFTWHWGVYRVFQILNHRAGVHVPRFSRGRECEAPREVLAVMRAQHTSSFTFTLQVLKRIHQSRL